MCLQPARGRGRQRERSYAIFNIATSPVRSLARVLHATQSCNVAVAFLPNPKKADATQRSLNLRNSLPELDQTSIFIDFILCIFLSSFPLFSGIMCLCISSFFSLAESHMAPSTWSEATSRVWLSTTSPMSTRASTSAVRPATSMARSVSPYPIPFHCKLWVSVYSYVLCTCCCG